MWTSKETEVINKDEYRFTVEEFKRGEDQMVFLHIDILKWTPSVFKELLRNWKFFREHVTCPLFAYAGADQETWEHFVTRLGFRFFQDVVCENGALRRLFVHTKENNNALTHFIDDQQLECVNCGREH
jgi:hypothetical protein